MRRKWLTPVLLLAVLCVICTVLIRMNSHGAAFTFGTGGVGIRFSRQPYEESIRPWYSEEEEAWIYFLPSALCTDRTIYNDGLDRELTIDGRAIPKRGAFTWEEGRTYRMVYDDRETDVRFLPSGGLPAIFITMEPEALEEINYSKNSTEAGSLTVFQADGQVSLHGGLTIHGRGNSSYTIFDKKPYNIKLDRPAGLLGMERARDWCLLANAWDYSYMNNKLAFDMAKNAGFRFTPDAEYADVWMNGTYRGLYLITEKIEVHENRIHITSLKDQNQAVNRDTDMTRATSFDDGSLRGIELENLPEDITGGYVIERDYRLAADYPGRKMTPSYFETTGAGTAFSIRAPEYADRREAEYIQALTSEMEQAILSPEGVSETGKGWLEYIDLDSWVKCYMIAEIAHDLDKDVTNTYYYKDTDSVDPRFYAGPVWDYDNRFGGTEGQASAEELTRLASGGPHYAGGWSRYLYDRPEFYAAVCREWKETFRDYLRETAPERIDGWQRLIETSVGLDLVRWPRNEKSPVLWPGGDGFREDYSFADEMDYLKDWIRKRSEFLDGIWGE